MQRLFTVKHMGTVAEYRAQFKMLVASVGRMDEENLTSIFVNGLEDQVRVELLFLSPRGLRKIMNVAGRIEQKNSILKPNYTFKRLPLNPSRMETRTMSWSTPNTHQPNNSQNIQSNTNNDPTQSNILNKSLTVSNVNPTHFNNKNTTNSTTSTSKFKRLTATEAQANRAKGLCYRCDETWHMGHVCRNRELHVILESDDSNSWEPS